MQNKKESSNKSEHCKVHLPPHTALKKHIIKEMKK